MTKPPEAATCRHTCRRRSLLWPKILCPLGWRGFGLFISMVISWVVWRLATTDSAQVVFSGMITE